MTRLWSWSFNEAAGIHRRKPGDANGLDDERAIASMRPPEFTGGNRRDVAPRRRARAASMRPPEFTGGNRRDVAPRRRARAASMRPPEFTGGNAGRREWRGATDYASMRPPEFTGGNPAPTGHGVPTARCFNEAAGIHRRKRHFRADRHAAGARASMRPPEFTGGNLPHPCGDITACRALQ